MTAAFFVNGLVPPAQGTERIRLRVKPASDTSPSHPMALSQAQLSCTQPALPRGSPRRRVSPPSLCSTFPASWAPLPPSSPLAPARLLHPRRTRPSPGLPPLRRLPRSEQGARSGWPAGATGRGGPPRPHADRQLRLGRRQRPLAHVWTPSGPPPSGSAGWLFYRISEMGRWGPTGVTADMGGVRAPVLGQSRVCGGSLSGGNVGAPRRPFGPGGPQPHIRSTENPFRQRGDAHRPGAAGAGNVCLGR